MRQRGLAAAAAVMAFVASPAVAADIQESYPAALPPTDSPVYNQQSMITGEVGLSLGWYDPEVIDSDGLAAINGRISFPLWGALYETVEAGAAMSFSNDGSGAGIISHTYFNNGGYALGGFIGAISVDSGGGSLTSVTGGAEGAVFLPNATLLGLIGYTSPETGPDFWTFQAEYRHYVTENDKLYALVARRNESPHWTVLGGYEHLFAGTNVSASGTAFWTGGSLETMGGWLTLTYLFGATPSLHASDNKDPFDGFTPALAGGLALSDARLKTDVVQVGMLGDDIPLYRFRYLWSDEVFVGVMAQDLLALRPDAVVVGSDGFYRVDYAALGTRMMRWDEWQSITAAQSPSWTDLSLAIAG